MRLTSTDALQMVLNAPTAGNDDHWKKHSICVGNTAAKIAKELKLDEDKARTLGFIHDFGKTKNYGHHDIVGYEVLKELGYDEEYARICLTHSYLNNDENCQAGGHPYPNEFRKEFIQNHKYTIYEKIINLCDLMCKQRVMTLEQRLIDLLIRKGVHDNTVYHLKEAEKLKNEIDNLLGYSVYQLFPEIITDDKSII